MHVFPVAANHALTADSAYWEKYILITRIEATVTKVNPGILFCKGQRNIRRDLLDLCRILFDRFQACLLAGRDPVLVTIMIPDDFIPDFYLSLFIQCCQKTCRKFEFIKISQCGRQTWVLVGFLVR